MSRLVEQYLDLFKAFEPRFALNQRRGASRERNAWAPGTGNSMLAPTQDSAAS